MPLAATERTMSTPSQVTPIRFWATSFYQTDWPEHAVEAPGIIAHLYELRAREKDRIASGVAPAAKSATGLFESNFDLFASSHPGLGKFVAFAAEALRQAVADVNRCGISASRLRVNFPDSWFHVTNEGGFHDSHYHGSCSWCGIYYLQAGDSGRGAERGAPNGGNRFYSPLARGGGYKDFGNQYLDVNYLDPPPRDGLLILFPSYLQHSALPYRGERDRIVISFNSCTVPA
jgi:uncharacterized protein (TIGR02466 family)